MSTGSAAANQRCWEVAA